MNVALRRFMRVIAVRPFQGDVDPVLDLRDRR
jgi:hypothetical protein